MKTSLPDPKLAIPGAVTFDAGQGGLPRIVVTAPGGTAQVYLHGAHVTYFQPAGQLPVLFMSGKSLFAENKAIRGGVPVIFPWFGPRAGDPAAPAHGFARTMAWNLLEAKAEGDDVTLRLGLEANEATRKWLPNDFDAVYIVRVGKKLDLSLEIRNRSSSPFRFEEALHTYLSVGDVRQVSIEGLSGHTFIDKTAAGQRRQQAGAIRIERETDRVYLDTTEAVTAIDPVADRQIIVSKEGSHTTVIWNPWIDKAKAMADFGDDEWPGMLCIETANAADNAIDLPPGGSHIMRASIGVK
jgi:glucose-6-phosphate 1-epimerase